MKTRCAPGRWCSVRYEDLLAEPEETLGRLCRTLGFEFDESMLRFHEGQAYATDRRNQEMLATPLRRDNTGKWLVAMSDKDVTLFESVARQDLIDLGYTPAAIRPVALGWMERTWREGFRSPGRRLWAMLKNKKGHRDGLVRLALRARALCRYCQSTLVYGAGHRAD